MDSVEGALWLASQTPNILCYLPSSNSRVSCSLVWISKKWRPGLHPWQAKKSSKLTTKQSLKTQTKRLNLVWPCLKVMVYVFNPKFIDKSQWERFVYKCKLILRNLACSLENQSWMIFFTEWFQIQSAKTGCLLFQSFAHGKILQSLLEYMN